MDNDKIQRTMEFILEQQAQYVIRMERDGARLTRLEEAFVTLVNLARIIDERQDNTDERQDNTDERVDTTELRLGILTEKMATLTEKTTILDEKMALLAEAQARTDQQLSALINVVERHISNGGNADMTS